MAYMKATLNSIFPRIETIKKMRELASPIDIVYVTGHTIANDNAFGSNFFKWNPTSVAADNGGTVIKLNSITTGRYELRYSGDINIKWFGAVGDGVNLCNTALDLAKSVNTTIFFPKGIFRIENYNLANIKIIGDSTNGASYSIQNTVIEGSGDIFINAADFSLYNITLRNSATGIAGKLITVTSTKDTAIGPIVGCNFLKADYHIYANNGFTIVGASIVGSIFREALTYSRYYKNVGLYQYSELDCYTSANNRGLYIKSTTACSLTDSVFEAHNYEAITIENTTTYSDTIRGLAIKTVHFERNGLITPTEDVFINVTLSKFRISFENCFYIVTAGISSVNLHGSTSRGRITVNNCTDITFANVGVNTWITEVNPSISGRSDAINVTNGGIRTTGNFTSSGYYVSEKGFTCSGSLTSSITTTLTLTGVAAPLSTRAAMVVVRDSTTTGTAILLIDDTTVTVVSSSLSTVTFSISSGFLAGIVTGGTSPRVMTFAPLYT